ncbi:hypothetical protein BGW39_003697 [Mortierella sp. 14UC]|nr:hypothetical protein BGW39_003697 [Mortierella sp. 14UC]
MNSTATKETEPLVSTDFRNVQQQQQLHRLSSDNLPDLNKNDTTRTKKHSSRCQYEDKSCTQNATQEFLTNFMDTYIGNTAIFRKSGGSDTVGFAFFLSSYVSAYKGVLCAMRRYRPYHQGGRLNAFVAGSAAGMTLLLDRNQSRRKTLMLYLFTRSVHFGSSYVMKKWAEHQDSKLSTNHLELKDSVTSSGMGHALGAKSGWDDILAKVMSASAAVVVMVLTASINLYACVIEPDAMLKSYWNMMVQHTGLPKKFGPMFKPLVEVFRLQFLLLKDLPANIENIRMPVGITSKEFVANNISPEVATLFSNKIHHEFRLCALLHPLSSCSGHFTDVLADEFERTAKMYSILNRRKGGDVFHDFINLQTLSKW